MSNVPTVAPFGTWKSPVSTRMLTETTVVLEDIRLEGDNLYWIEGRPHEMGRHALVEKSLDHGHRERTPSSFDVHSRVHEYGGGAFAVHDSVVYFSDGGDQRLYRLALKGQPQPLTVEGGDTRYGDLEIDPSRGRLLAVRERHQMGYDAENVIVAVPVGGTAAIDEVVVSGHDFYMAPRVSPDGSQLAFIAWNHPHMPWDSTQLFVAPLSDDGTVGRPRAIAGGPNESVCQPMWSPDNQLYFISDKNDWWNLYVWRNNEVIPITALHADFADAPWALGVSSYGFSSASEIVAAYSMNGFAKLVRIDVYSREMAHIACPFSTLSHLQVSSERVAMLAGSDRAPRSVVVYDFATRRYRITARSSQAVLDEEDTAIPEPVEFPNEDGSMSYGFYYGPKNRDYSPPEGERPPLILVAHGGPTDRCDPEFRLEIQYWTTRGFAVVEVNYGGSTGYGRAYRHRLDGRWGIVDVGDLVSAADFLARYGKADPRRLIVRGYSAGGFTALAALAQRDHFRAACSYFGISDLTALRRTLPKFESHYLDTLVGPYSEALYRERSPLAHRDRIDAPVIFFHGLDDRVVDPRQTQMLVDSLAERGLPVGSLFFPGEGHGFSDPATVERCYEAELAFYARVLDIRLAERAEPLPMKNWP